MEIATRNGITPGSAGLAQAHPPTESPAVRKKPSAGLGPVTVHPTHLGVGLPLSSSFFLRKTRKSPYEHEHAAITFNFFTRDTSLYEHRVCTRENSNLHFIL